MTTIVLNHISVLFHTPTHERLALDDVSLVIPSGQWVALIGANGSGKSTLGAVLAGLSEVSAGTRSFLQMNKCASPRVRRITQNPETQLIGQTIEEELLGVLPPEEQSDFAELTKRFTDVLCLLDLNKPLKTPIDSLSGGEKQRLAIASALLSEATLLVCDECTSMLDELHRDEVRQAMKAVHKRGVTIVWITQILDELSLADRVVALVDQQVAYDGTPDDFFYGREQGGKTACAALRFTRPYIVETAHSLQEMDVLPWCARPLTVNDLLREMEQR